MKHQLRLERAALACGLAGVAAVFWALALVASPGKADSGRVRDVAVTAERFDAAIAARADRAAGTRFDALVGSLAAGLGSDTPAELGPALAAIRSGRERERGAKAPDAAVDRGLAEAARALGRAEAAAPARDARVVAVTGAAAAFVALGIAGFGIALRLRREERRVVAVLCGVDPSAAHDGRLVGEVGKRLAVARPREEPGGVIRPITDVDAFGRVLEIVAVDEM